jgi:hypothetical protein
MYKAKEKIVKTVHFLTLALWCGISLHTSIVAQTAQPQNVPAENLHKKATTSWPALSQKILLDKSNKLDKKAATITLQLDNLQSDDLVNIAPSNANNSDNATVDFSATTYFVTGDPEKKSFLDLVSFGAAPAEANLQVGHNSINFGRDKNLSGKLLINIQLPTGTPIKLVINNNTIINSAISQPIAWHNGSMGKGEANRFAALLKTVKPNIRELPSGTARVKFDQLKTRSQSSLPLKEGVLILVRLSINPAGRVTEAKLLYGEAGDDVINSFYNWEFEPHLVNGKPAPVETVVSFRY